MNVLSLFDGMSCGRIALERAGIQVDNYYSSEIDKYAIQIATKNYPQDTANRLGDVTQLKEEDLKKLNIDLLIGGSPCQGFSVAGKSKGSSTVCGIDVISLVQYEKLKDEGFEFDGQSFLFWEFVRVWKSIKPKYFFLENVKIDKKWLPMFNEAMGVEPIFIDSKIVSGALRKRFYWTNIELLDAPKDKGITLLELIDLNNIEDTLENITDKMKKKVKGTLSHTKAWGNVRQLKDKAKCLTTAGQGVTNSSCSNIQIGDNYYRPIPKLSEMLMTVPIGYTEGVSTTQRHKMLGNGWTVDVVTHLFRGLAEQ